MTTNHPTSSNVVVYLRISKDSAGLGLGVARQLREIKELCERQGLTILNVFEDNDISAYSGKRRPQYEAMLQAIADPTIPAIVSWAVDRLTRSPRDLENLIDRLDATDTKVLTVQGGLIDLSTAEGKMMARVVGAVARAESERKSARARAKSRQLIESGLNNGGGHRAFGYDRDGCTVNKAEAVVVTEMAARVLAGDTLVNIARDLNRRQVPTVTGVQWRATTVRHIIRGERIAGLRVYRGGNQNLNQGQEYAGSWPAIISTEDHRRLVALLDDPRRVVTPTRGRAAYLLTGLLVCGKCGAFLKGRPTAGGHRAYTCKKAPGFAGCGSLTVDADRVEDKVRAAVETVIADGGLARLVAADTGSADDSDLQDEIVKVNAEIGDLRVMAKGGKFGAATLLEIGAGLEDRKADLMTQLSLTATTRARVAQWTAQTVLPTSWPEDPTAQRVLVHALLRAVKIAPSAVRGGRFNDSRIQLDDAWKI